MGQGMKLLWNSKKVDGCVGGTSSAPWICSGISIDTRTLQRGDLFVALKGETGDGHAYLQVAHQKGAAAALVSEEVKTPLPLLRVADTLQALEKIGNAARDRSSATRIAITGSVGKTGTKDALKWVLKGQGRTHASVSSYNNHWGVPLTLARMPEETQFGIFEIGMNHTGEIRPLSQLVKPHVSIITSIVEAHAEFFDSVEDIARAKAEIFEGMEKGGVAILNRDNPYFDLLSQIAQEQGLTIYGFGKSEKADFKLLSWQGEAERSTVMVDICGQKVTYSLPMPGLHWALNSLAVLGAIYLTENDITKTAQSLSTLEVPSGRGGWHKGSFTVIDESYNANPASMKAALVVLGQSGGTRKIAVIGDMREMGKQSRSSHEGLLEDLLQNQIDLVFCCGPYMAYLYDCLPQDMKGGYAPTSLELTPLVLKAIQPGDVVSVKASLGTRVKPIVEALLDLQRNSLKKVS